MSQSTWHGKSVRKDFSSSVKPKTNIAVGTNTGISLCRCQSRTCAPNSSYPNTSTKISTDVSSFGLGAVLLQKSGDVWKLRCYAQIEKEALAVTWACNKFAEYVIGKHFQIESDHKPLFPLLNSIIYHQEFYALHYE